MSRGICVFGHADEAVDGVGLQKRLLVDVERLRGDEGLAVRRWDEHALAKLSSVGAVLGSAPGGFEAVKPPRLGFGKDRGFGAGVAGGHAGRGQRVEARHEWSLV